MNIRWNIVLSIIALSLLAWFYSLNQDEDQLNNLIKTQESPEYTGLNMETVLYSPTNGQRQYIARSDKVAYFETDGRTEFDKPVVYLYDIDQKNIDQQSWTLKANLATLTQDNMLYLTGDVVVQSLLADSRLQRIATQSAVVNLTNHDISSDSRVQINGQNFVSTGLKLTGNLQQQIATLQEQVQTHYEINNN